MKNVCNPTFTNANYLMSCQNREVLDFISVIVSVYEVCFNVNYGILEYCVAMSKIEIVSVVSFFVATYLRCGGVVNNQIKKGFLYE